MPNAFIANSRKRKKNESRKKEKRENKHVSRTYDHRLSISNDLARVLNFFFQHDFQRTVIIKHLTKNKMKPKPRN